MANKENVSQTQNLQVQDIFDSGKYFQCKFFMDEMSTRKWSELKPTEGSVVVDSQPSFEKLTYCHILFCECIMQSLSLMNFIKTNEDAGDLEKCRGLSVFSAFHFVTY